MSGCYIYEANCADFSTLGMCGRLDESRCDFEEIANGMSELTVEHPIDPHGRYRLLAPGRILKAVVPVRNVPEVDDDTQTFVTVVEQWTVSTTASWSQRTLYNKRAEAVQHEIAEAQAAGRDTKGIEQKKLTVLKRGRKVTVVKNYGTTFQEWKIKCGKYTGFIDRDALVDGVTQQAGAGEDPEQWFERVSPSWTCKEQLFRIYSVRRQGDNVVARARHLFYDNMTVLTSLNSASTNTLKTVLGQLKARAIGNCGLEFHTNITGSLSGARYADQNIVEALLDPESGCAARWKADVIRDGDECYLLGRAGFDRGVWLERGYDLAGVQYTAEDGDAVSHIRPIGENEDGTPLYLTGTGLVASSRASEFPFMKVLALKLSEARVDTEDGITVARAREMMRAAAAEKFAEGADQPEIGVSVTFALLGNSPKYAAYRGLKNLFLFDTVGVRDRELGISVQARVTRITWDCRRERMTEVELGTLKDLSPRVSAVNIEGRISGSQLKAGSVTGLAISNHSVTASAIAKGAVSAAALSNGSVTTDIIADSTVTEAKLAGSVTSSISAAQSAAAAAQTDATEALTTADAAQTTADEALSLAGSLLKVVSATNTVHLSAGSPNASFSIDLSGITGALSDDEGTWAPIAVAGVSSTGAPLVVFAGQYINNTSAVISARYLGSSSAGYDIVFTVRVLCKRAVS